MNLKVFKVSLKTPGVIMQKREAQITGTTGKFTFKSVETIRGMDGYRDGTFSLKRLRNLGIRDFILFNLFSF